MKVVKPISVTSSELISSSIAEPDTSVGEVEWSSNLNDSWFSVDESVTSISSSQTVDYVINFDGGSHIMSEYLNGTLQYQGAVTAVNSLASDSHYYNGFVYIADLTDVRYFDVSTKSSGTMSITGGVESGTVWTSIASYGTSFYLYDRGNKKIKQYSLSGSTLTYQSEVSVNIGNEYPKLTVSSNGGFLSLKNGEVDIYTDAFTLIGTKTLDDVAFGSESYGGIANNGSLIKIANPNKSRVESYDYSLRYNGLYAVGYRVIKTSTHMIYQCSTETDLDPEDSISNVPPEWVEVGPTNKWSMFDNKRTVKSSSSGAISVSLEFDNQTDSINILSMENATSVSIIATSNSSGEVYNQSFDVTNKIDLVVLDIPPFDDLTYDVIVSGSQIKVGEIVVGVSRDLGTLVSGVVSDRIDYSRIEYDDFGNDEYIERPMVKYTTYPVMIPKSESPSVELYLDNLQKAQALWVGDTGGGDLLVTYGRLERSPITYSNPSIVEYLIKVRGSI